MEPASIVSLAGACLTLVMRTARDLNDIAAKFHKMDQKVRLIAAQLNTITTTLSQLETWLKGQPHLHADNDISNALAGAISACTTVVSELSSYLGKLKGGWLSSRFMWIWDEGEFLQYQRALDSQINALGLFLNVILLNSQTRRQSVLETPANRHALRQAQDQASIYSSRRRSTASSVGESSSSAAGRSRDASSSSFTFHDQLFESATYQGSWATSTKKGKDDDDAALSPAAESLSTAFSPLSPIPPLIGQPGITARRDSDAMTVTTTSTSSTGTSSSSSRSSTFDLEKLSGRSRSWTSRSSKQAHLARRLCLAARNGDAPLIQSLVGQGADVNGRYGLQQQDEGGGLEKERGGSFKRILQRSASEPTPLHYAAEAGHAEAVTTLVSCGADLRARARGGRTPLHVANGAPVVTALVERGADPSLRDDTDAVPLHRLAADGQLEAITALVSTNTSSVDAVNKLRQTPLHLACKNDHSEVAQALLQAGAYVNAADADGLRPLHYVARHGARADLVRILRAAGADVEAQARDLFRPLHHAARHGRAAVVEALLLTDETTTTTTTPSSSPAATVDPTTADGSTPLHLAAQSSNDPTAAAAAEPTTAALLAHGAPVCASNARSEQPLHLALANPANAITRAALAVVALLLAHGADPNARLRDGSTPLMRACGAAASSGAQDVLAGVELLLRHGADANAVGRGDAAALSPLAVACGRAELASDVVRLLVAGRPDGGEGGGGGGGGARPRHQDFRALWRNGRLSVWEKRAAHAIMTEVAEPALRRDEVEWLIVAR